MFSMAEGQRGPATRRYSAEPVYCGNCGDEIEACWCDNEWMHTSDRSERCVDGRYARPETEGEYQTESWRRRRSGGRRP